MSVHSCYTYYIAGAGIKNQQAILNKKSSYSARAKNQQQHVTMQLKEELNSKQTASGR
jgi:hypothetical protein